MDVGVGRFTQQDTYLGNIYSPITLNKYTYANSDGVNWIDPSGNVGLVSFGVSNNIRGILTTSASAGFQQSFRKALWGEVKDGVKDQLTEAAFGVIGEFVVGSMVSAVDSVSYKGSAQGFGSKAHKQLDDLVKENSKKLNKYLRKYNARIEAEVFRYGDGSRTSGNGKKRAKGSMGIDVTIVNRTTDKVILGFDLKTGKAGTSKRKLPGYRRSHNNSPIIDVFVSRTK